MAEKAFKSKYTFQDFWEEFTKGTLYRSYARANVIESSKLAEIAQKKIKQEAYFLPIDIIKTHTGMAIAMLINTLS